MSANPVWILVMGATRARILRGMPNHGAAGKELVLRSEHRRLKEIMANGPEHGVEARALAVVRGSDPLRSDEEDFVRRVIDFLGVHLAAGDFAALVVFAEPSALGTFHALAPERISRRVSQERALDLLHLPPADLAAAIARELGAI